MSHARRLLLAAGGSGAFTETDMPTGWISVKNYGATGDGGTDDTAAIAAAIADIPTQGAVLFFPPGQYKTSGGFTLPHPTTVLGCGGSGDSGHVYATPISEILCTSQTAVLFTVAVNGCAFLDIALSNTYAGNPTAGSAVAMSGGYFARFDRCTVSRFYDNISISNGAGWAITDCFIYDPVRYGLRVQGTVSPDSGDQSMTGCYFMADTHSATAAVFIESAGGLKISNTKINERGTGGRFVTGIDIAPAASTSVLLLTGVSIENVSGDGVRITTSGGFGYGQVVLSGCQFGLYSNAAGHAVKVNCGTLADVNGLVIAGCSMVATGSSASAVDITKVDKASIGPLVVQGFSSTLTQSGSTNIATV